MARGVNPALRPLSGCPLTRLELRYLYYRANGLRQYEMAEREGRAVHTIKNNSSRLYRKLDLDDSYGRGLAVLAVILAFKKGWIR